jgi:DNA-binding PucR family transcriptional regulator
VDVNESPSLTGAAKAWHSFLFGEAAEPPKMDSDRGIRFIQFRVSGVEPEIQELQAVIKEFFYNSLAFFWLDETNGVIVEQKAKGFYGEEEIQAIAVTLENDFYIKPFFYIGKFRYDVRLLRRAFFHERKLFFEAITQHSGERVFTFEKIFPAIVAKNLPEKLRAILDDDVIQLLKEDPELRKTMEVFLKRNSNVSMAAKKLHVHRNTLQYRLEKFTDKTGVNLKNFHSALAVYLACLIAE